MDYIDISAWSNEPAPKRRSRKEILARRKKRRRQMMFARTILAAAVLLAGILLALAGWRIITYISGLEQPVSDIREQTIRESESDKPEIVEDFLTVNPYSRPGEALGEVRNIFIHYTANRGTSAEQNRSYFENLGITGERSASAHFVIGYDGKIIQCLPLDEIAYAVKTRNYDSISIECCYTSEDGSFTDATYESLISLTAWLLKKYDLVPADVLRHYDVGGKKCPIYYVENEGEWDQFLQDLEDYILRSGQ